MDDKTQQKALGKTAEGFLYHFKTQVLIACPSASNRVAGSRCIFGEGGR
ncbi:hypothetical protein BH09BAC1_BH09BAC1_17550 [soil metagenome]